MTEIYIEMNKVQGGTRKSLVGQTENVFCNETETGSKNVKEKVKAAWTITIMSNH